VGAYNPEGLYQASDGEPVNIFLKIRPDVRERSTGIESGTVMWLERRCDGNE
jgi:hypothetical protein